MSALLIRPVVIALSRHEIYSFGYGQPVSRVTTPKAFLIHFVVALGMLAFIPIAIAGILAVWKIIPDSLANTIAWPCALVFVGVSVFSWFISTSETIIRRGFAGLISPHSGLRKFDPIQFWLAFFLFALSAVGAGVSIAAQ